MVSQTLKRAVIGKDFPAPAKTAASGQKLPGQSAPEKQWK